MFKELNSFLLSLTAFLLLTFLAHILILEIINFPLFDTKIISAYLINFVLATTVFLGLNFLRKKHNATLGYFFLGGSFLKFFVFFVFFYPYYNADELISKVEFLAFFVPYAVSLMVETYCLIKILNA